MPNEHGIFPGDEKIDSDLDDSEDDGDDEDEDGAGGEDANMDIVFCVYDKVSPHPCLPLVREMTC